MIVDSSALVAICLDEGDARLLSGLIIHSSTPVATAAPTLLEASIGLERVGGHDVVADLDRFIAIAQIEIVPFGGELVDIARLAYRQFGRGSGHPAHLNFGDCFSYALAVQRAVPLLFKGEDFSRTDVRPAWIA